MCACIKASQILGLIYRHFYHHSNSAAILHLYISLVRPNLEYMPVLSGPPTLLVILLSLRVGKNLLCVWHPTTGQPVIIICYSCLVSHQAFSSQEIISCEEKAWPGLSHPYKIVHNLCYFPPGLIHIRSQHSYFHSLPLHAPIFCSHYNYYVFAFLCS